MSLVVALLPDMEEKEPHAGHSFGELGKTWSCFCFTAKMAEQARKLTASDYAVKFDGCGRSDSLSIRQGRLYWLKPQRMYNLLRLMYGRSRTDVRKMRSASNQLRKTFIKNENML